MYQMGIFSEQGERKNCASPASEAEDTSPFLLLMKKMYQVILVRGSMWISDACLRAGSYTTNAVKLTSSQITRELFRRAERGRLMSPSPLSPRQACSCLQWSALQIATSGLGERLSGDGECAAPGCCLFHCSEVMDPSDDVQSSGLFADSLHMFQ